MEAKLNREPHKLPDKMLRVYFIWSEDGIKFRWELLKGCCKVLRSGGDEITTQRLGVRTKTPGSESATAMTSGAD